MLVDYFYALAAILGCATLFFVHQIQSIRDSMIKLRKMEIEKTKYSQEVTEPTTTHYKGAVVTVYPSGQFLVQGENDAHCRMVHDEIQASFERRYVCD